VKKFVIKASEIEGSLEKKSHPLDSSVERHAVSLGDLTGLSRVGIHLTHVKPGKSTTVRHSHKFADEFIFVLSGKGTLQLDDARFEIGVGDFVGLPAEGPSHALTNSGVDDLVYLVGGDRQNFDVCDYPELGKRLYFYTDQKGKQRDFVSQDDVTPL
jgi:uncharacterized cupin superfamily protein